MTTSIQEEVNINLLCRKKIISCLLQFSLIKTSLIQAPQIAKHMRKQNIMTENKQKHQAIDFISCEFQILIL